MSIANANLKLPTTLGELQSIIAKRLFIITPLLPTSNVSAIYYLQLIETVVEVSFIECHSLVGIAIESRILVGRT